MSLFFRFLVAFYLVNGNRDETVFNESVKAKWKGFVNHLGHSRGEICVDLRVRCCTVTIAQRLTVYDNVILL